MKVSINLYWFLTRKFTNDCETGPKYNIYVSKNTINKNNNIGSYLPKYNSYLKRHGKLLSFPIPIFSQAAAIKLSLSTIFFNFLKH